ncbi:hypothetical protein PQX77_020885 [Marasmius sp. AFHP31]|nr:hypothetical protein PQX77_020885 [Marasmius sp. AFHP31]
MLGTVAKLLLKVWDTLEEIDINRAIERANENVKVELEEPLHRLEETLDKFQTLLVGGEKTSRWSWLVRSDKTLEGLKTCENLLNDALHLFNIELGVSGLTVKSKPLSAEMPQREIEASKQVQYINHGDQNIAREEAIDLGRHLLRSFTTATVDSHQSLWNAVSEIGASHRAKQQIERGYCLPGTCEKALGTICEWTLAGDQGTPICLLTGPVGVGKSTIAMTVAKSCEEEGLLASSFFFLRSDPKRKDPSALVPTIAHGLVSTIPLLRRHIEERISRDPTILEAELKDQFQELVFGPLLIYKGLLDRADKSSSERELPRIAIIDGLDECGDEEIQLCILSTIRTAFEHTPHLPLRFLICSRSESWIQETFATEALGRLTKFVVPGDSLESNEDIMKFYLHHFQGIVGNPKYEQVQFPDPWPSEDVLRTLVRRTCGQFVYALTFVEFVKSRYQHPITQFDYLFANTPDHRQGVMPYRELDALYHSILCANPNHKEVLSILTAVLGISVGLPRSPAFIELLLGLPSGQVALSLRGMHSVLAVHGWKDAIYTHHTSFREYLFDRGRSAEFHVDECQIESNVMQWWLQSLATKKIRMYSAEQLYCDETRPFFTQWIYELALYRPTRSLLDALRDVDLASVFFCDQASNFFIYDFPTALGRTRVDVHGPGWCRTFQELIWWTGSFYDEESGNESKSNALDNRAAKNKAGQASEDQNRKTPDDLVDGLMDKLSIRPTHFHLKPPPGASLEDDIVYWTVLLATACTNRTRLTSRAHSAGERQAPAQLTDCHCDFTGGNQSNDPSHVAYQEACMHLVKTFILDFEVLLDNDPDEETMVELNGIFGNLVDSSLLRHCRLETDLLSLCETFFKLAEHRSLLQVRQREWEARRMELLRWIETFPENFADQAESLKLRVIALFSEKGEPSLELKQPKTLRRDPCQQYRYSICVNAPGEINMWNMGGVCYFPKLGRYDLYATEGLNCGLYAPNEWADIRVKTFRKEKPDQMYILKGLPVPCVLIGYAGGLSISNYFMHGPQCLSAKRLQMELRAFRRQYSKLNENEVRKIDSQEYLDRWQSIIVSDLPGKVIPPSDRTAILNAMLQLSHASGVAPKCLRIQDVGIENLVLISDSRSGKAEVFRGKVGRLDVTVKALRKLPSEDDVKVGSQQALSWQILAHKNILPFLGLFYLDNSRTRVCLVYPWMEQSGRLTSVNLQGVADGFGYLHSKNVTHGHLKISSVLVDSAGIPRIGDLGLALLSGEARVKDEDIYQFGRVIHELCEGTFPGGTNGLHRPLDVSRKTWNMIKECSCANPTFERPRSSSSERHEVQGTDDGRSDPRSFPFNIVGEWSPSLVRPSLDVLQNIIEQNVAIWDIRPRFEEFHNDRDFSLVASKFKNVKRNGRGSLLHALFRYIAGRDAHSFIVSRILGTLDLRPSSGRPFTHRQLEKQENAFRSLLDDPDYDEVVGLQDEEAQDVLDVWQRVRLDEIILLAITHKASRKLSECTADADLRSHIIKASIQLSNHSGLSPHCLQISEVEDLSDAPVEYGGAADIWTGNLEGVKVAVKVIQHRLGSQKHGQTIKVRLNTLAFITRLEPGADHDFKAFTREALIWRNLNHPNILPFTGMYWFNEAQGQLCLVSPWMENGNLLQFLSDNPDIDLATQQRLAKDVAQGLAHLHGLQITHGDIKGVNVLITPDHNACITDFGLSRVIDSPRLAGLFQASDRQDPERWLAPELLKTGKRAAVSPESDIYAFGCVCYELYAKRAPFEDVEEYGIYHIVVVQNQRPELPQQVPEGMRRLINNCWRTEPGSRPKAVDIIDEIGRVYGGRPDQNAAVGRNKPAYLFNM